MASQFPDLKVEFKTTLFAPAYGVLGRHGHEWDENCHGWEFSNKVLKKNQRLNRFEKKSYEVQALGEVITAELMGGLIYRVAQELDLSNPKDADFFNNLKNVNNLRPMLAVFTWLEWLTRNQLDKYKIILFNALRDSLSGLLDSTFARRWDKIESDFIVSGDLTDRLELVRKKLKKGDFDDLRDTLRWVAPFQKILGLGGKKDKYAKGARKEWEISRNSQMFRIQYIVYGHTHNFKQLCYSGNRDGTVKMYLNTGTFLPLIQTAQDKNSFYSGHRMTMAFFFKNDEDSNRREGTGPTVDLWNGIRRKVYN